MTEDEELFLASRSAVIIHDEHNRIGTDIFEDEIFLVASHPVDGDIESGNPILFSVDEILIKVFPGSGMIVSGDDLECLVGDDSGIDTSGSAADASSLDIGYASHDSESRNRIALPIFSSRIIMDLIHEGKLLLRIEHPDVSDIPIRDGDIVFSPSSIGVDPSPVGTDDISEILEVLGILEQINMVELSDLLVI